MWGAQKSDARVGVGYLIEKDGHPEAVFTGSVRDARSYLEGYFFLGLLEQEVFLRLTAMCEAWTAEKGQGSDHGVFSFWRPRRVYKGQGFRGVD